MTHPFIIAEVSSNHSQNLERCYQFIDVAAQIGCDAVKFQLFKIDQLFAPEILSKSAQHRDRKQWELPLDFLPKLSKRCKERGIKFGCTPFYIDAVEELAPYVDFYKISSYEMIWTELLDACCKTNIPLIMSTGMATEQEIRQAVETVAHRVPLTLLHCVSSYPTPIEQCNLAAISTLREKFQCMTGWSDHSVQEAAILSAALKHNASAIEFHLDLDQHGEEYAAGHCWLPEQIQPVITRLKQASQAEGNGTISVAKGELADRDWRADPTDGLRPLKSIRATFQGDSA
ncbi:N-acetylneuraminate synthase family protein [Neptuniibacter sp. QD48_55]|uniref:N-acetylneuraminate synthase family protein n=1 Tax=Neptuniibacter sp. QD48_55 TaxID=3398212 RepID=UPI0039F5CCD9